MKVFLFVFGVSAAAYGQSKLLTALNPFWSFLWTGWWEYEDGLVNRADLRIQLPWQSLSLRFQVIDKRDDTEGRTAFSGGLYHKPTGSRLLYGVMHEQGLGARLRSPWSRSLPFPAQHTPSGADVQTTPSATKEPIPYLYLKTPQLGIFRGFASAALDAELTPKITGGLEAKIQPKTSLTAEGFYTGKTLDAYQPGAWFSEKPPLPERDFRLYGLSVVYGSPFFGVAGDWGYSDTVAYGRDMYGNAGIRIGSRPWQVSVGAEYAGSRYVGSDGAAPGPGFRLGGKAERFGKKAALFQFTTAFRAGAFGEPFERSSTRIYYRFPTGFGSLPVKPLHLSLTAARNASKPEKTEDSLTAGFGIHWKELRFVCSGTLTGISAPAEPLPFPFPEESLAFNSAKIEGEVSYRLGFWGFMWGFTAKLGYRAKKNAEPLWNTAAQVSIQRKNGGLSLKAASPDFPSRWTYTVAWRLQKK